MDESSGGNGQLKYPVGLMTADELAFSGMVDTAPMKENRYWYGYLNSVLTSVVGENEWWLISPVRFDWDRYGETIGKVFNGDRARVENVSIRGSFHIVRPVISLKSCVEYSKGNGLSDSPYEVSIDESCKLAVN